MFINIVRNACEAVTAGDVVKLQVNGSLADQVSIHVNNGGEPIPAEVLAKLSQPFFSTKPCGTGLGLAITKRMALLNPGMNLSHAETQRRRE
ncbi:ATP-binding protein [Nostoc sp. MG11]|uniref:ATP-binding protein n=1 Tax=Nostoc sp. MG11 TaxID=2721166 RepID=UPI0018670DD7|nr:ATP-binding protein [Nostoc sp. MG11]